MRLLKPEWVSLDGKPIFSIDIHPDGSRFATGGQGDNSGKVVVWNMAPVKNEADEKNESVPKMLCQMDNHFGCVNCVRWSGNGRYLASGGDDKLIMIWQTSRHAGASSTFGSAGGIINVEQWRVGSTLRGHSGDVLDLAWSPNDIWLASCSIDNTVIVWNAQKFPEQVSVIRGHSGLVKGVTWDPVGKYLASQSDDKTLRVWRTLDWQQDACIKEPFKECGGTTHVLRISWSPDGQYVVSAHAMNNSGPTAQIVERDGWQTNMDFVGHRKAITVVRFNPCILSKRIKDTALKPQNFTCCAIGSKDRSISIWLTALKRPLVVTHDLFTSTVLDASWSQTGMELLVCSWDGTVAYLSFDKDEIGRPLLPTEKMELHKSLYGKTALSAGGGGLGTQIVESADLFDLQQPKLKPPEAKPPPEEKPPSAENNNRKPEINMNGNLSSQTPTKTAMPPPSNRQIETRTKDGKRRITPIFLAPQPEFGEAPLPFCTNNSSEPQFTSSKEQSTIIVEKKETRSPPSTPLKHTHTSSSTSPATGDSPARPTALTPVATTPKSSISAAAVDSSPSVHSGTPSQTATPMNTEKCTSEKPITSQSTPNIPTADRLTDSDAADKDRLKLSIKRKSDTLASGGYPMKRGPGRPRKDRAQEMYSLTPVQTTPTIPQQAPVLTEQTRVVYAASGLNLPTPSIDKSISMQISGTVGSDSSVVVEVENGVSMPGVGTLCRVRCLQQGLAAWECLRSSKIMACAGNSHVVCVSCEDNSVTVYNAQSGRQLCPSMVLDSKLSVLRCSGYYLMAITTRGNLFVWDTRCLTAVIKNVSLVTIITSKSVKLEKSLLTEHGIPVLTVSTGKTFTYKCDLGCWVLLSDRCDVLHMCSDHQTSQPHNMSKQGPLAIIQASAQRPGNHARLLHNTDPTLRQSATLSHLENQLSSALVLKSGHEYHFWMLTYVRYLSQEAIEDKLRDICGDLLGPTYKSKSSTWQSTILGVNKRELLREILPIIASNLKLQRLYTEYQEQLESI